MGRNDTSTTYKVFWSWNSVTSWMGSGQTGNACALFDTGTDGNINFVICVAVQNNTSNPAEVKQVVGSPYAFTCSNSRADRCGNPSPITPLPAGAVLAGLFGNPSNSTADLVTVSDPFPDESRRSRSSEQGHNR
jgi:hypothetical protein